MLHLKILVRAQEKTKKEINFIGLKRKIYVINMLTMIKMNGILSIRNKEAKKMVKGTHEKYKGSRLSSQHGQFYSFEGKSCECGRWACLLILYQIFLEKTVGHLLSQGFWELYCTQPTYI